MTQPVVSVVIPVFNGAQYIREAIESVLNQTYKSIEIVVIDDGSTDNTKSVIDEWIGSNRIRYIYQENRGLAAARNTGIKAAGGRFIKFLDSDDFLYPQQIGRQVEQITLNEKYISISDSCFLRSNGEIIERKYYPADEGHFQLASFFDTNPAPVHAFLVRKSLVQKAGCFDENLKACEDWDLWIRILQQGAVIKHLPLTGCCYRISAVSMSSDSQKMFIHRCRVIEKTNIWLLKKENLDMFEINGFWFKSIAAINNKLIDEGFARGIPLKNDFVNAVRMLEYICNQKGGTNLKGLPKVIGIRNYLRVKYLAKILFQKNYKYNLLYEDEIWKAGKVHRSD